MKSILDGENNLGTAQATNQREVVVLGKNPTEEVKEEVSKQAEAEKPTGEPEKAKTEEVTTGKKETDDPKKEVADPKKETSDPSTIKVSFGKKNEKEEVKTDPITDKKETVSVNEQSVISFLKEKGINVNSISDLAKPTPLSEEVEKFQKFQEETGRGLRDFYNTQKDWSKVEKDDTILEFYKLSNELTDDEAKRHLNILKLSEDEEDELSPRQLEVRKLEYDNKYNEALKFMTKKANDYKTPLDIKSEPKQLTAEEITNLHKPYWSRRDKSLEKLNEVKMSLEGFGEVVTKLNADQKALIAQTTQTQADFFQRFKDDPRNPDKVNTDLATEATLWSIPEIRQSILTNWMQQAHSLIITKMSQENRNVQLDKNKEQPAITKSGSRLVVHGGSQEESNYGQPIF